MFIGFIILFIFICCVGVFLYTKVHDLYDNIDELYDMYYDGGYWKKREEKKNKKKKVVNFDKCIL